MTVHSWCIRTVALCVVVFFAGCSGRGDTAAPRETVVLTGQARRGCDTVCVVAEGVAPFQAMFAPNDSLDAESLIARLVWYDVSAGAIQIRLVGAAELNPSEAAQRLRIHGILNTTPTLAELASGVEVSVTSHADSIVLYLVRRRSMHVTHAERLQLIVTSPKSPSSVTAPWARRGPPVSTAVVQNEDECDFAFPQSSCGNGVTATLSVVIASVGNGTFQSNGGTNASRQMEVSFSSPVTSVTVTIHDPTYSGNTVQALNAAGALVALEAFTGNNQPGVYSADTRTVSATSTSGLISRIVLIPADLDYVAYSLSFRVGQVDFTVSCLPATVQRGETIMCSMALSDGTAPKDPEWTFDSPSISDELPRPIRYPGASGSDTPMTTWFGEIVISGEVTGSALINGQRVTERATVAVTPRAWRSSGIQVQRRAVDYVGQGALPSVPTKDEDLGKADLGARLLRCNESGAGCSFITRGPNRGLGYLTLMPITLSLAVSINETALAVNSSWRQSFPSSRVNGRCARSDIEGINLRDLVLQHEGLNPDVHVNSHTRIFRDAMDTTGVSIMETGVYGAIPTVASLFEQANAAAFLDAKQIDQASSLRNPLRLPGCRLF